MRKDLHTSFGAECTSDISKFVDSVRRMLLGNLFRVFWIETFNSAQKAHRINRVSISRGLDYMLLQN